jgi:putative ABC transport system permease protein
MGAVLRIALRNLVQHRSKTLIIGTLITLAVALGLVGNTVFHSAQESLKKTFTQNFTGDVLILPKSIQGGIFGASNGGNGNGPPILPLMKDYEKVYALVKAEPEVAHLTSQISAYVLFNLQDSGLNFGLAFGIDPADYFKTFDNIVMLSGHKLRPGETGILLHEKVVKALKEQNDVDLKVGDEIQLNNFGEAGFKIRQVPIVGIFKFRAGNERSFAFMQPNFVDVNTLRALKGNTILTPSDLKFDAKKTAELDMSDSDFFSGATVTAHGSQAAARPDLAQLLPPPAQTSDPVSAKSGAWNYILIKVKPQVQVKAFVDKLNELFDAQKLDVKAQDWVPSAQPDSGVFFAISVIFNVVIWLLAIVSVIIIMNTLVASVMERTAEIGTMRALGAQKGFVRNLFIVETLAITALFGGLGIVLGLLLLTLLHFTGLPAPNDFMRLIFGGPRLYPNLDLGQVGVSLAVLLLIALVSWVLPVRMALRVSPLKAIQSD